MSYKMILIQGSTVVRIHIESKGKAEFALINDEMREKPFLSRTFPVNKENAAAVLHNDWLVECMGKEMSVYCTKETVPRQCIEISFNQQDGSSIILMTEGFEYSFSKVQRLEILEHQIRILLANDAAGVESVTEKQGGVTDIILLSDHLQEMQNKERIIYELTQQNEKQMEVIKKLQTAAHANLENIGGILNEDLRRISENEDEAVERLQRELNERNSLIDKLKSIKEEIHSAELKKLSLQEMLVKKKGIWEVLKTDNEYILQLKASLDTLTRQIEFDKETVEALEDSTNLKYNCIKDTVGDIGKQIESVERRIELILRVKEEMNNRINAATSLDEWISLNDEAWNNSEAGSQTKETLTDTD